MNIPELRERLAKRPWHTLCSYAINDETAPWTTVIASRENGTWDVYYNEKGRQSLQTFDDESAACEEFYARVTGTR